MFTFTASAQYGILSAVQLNEGAEDQYLALEAFFGPVHDLAIEKGIENFQAVWKVTSDSADENAPHYIIYTGFESKEQLDAYNNSWTSEDWVALAKEAHKGSISASRVERIMNNVLRQRNIVSIVNISSDRQELFMLLALFKSLFSILITINNHYLK